MVERRREGKRERTSTNAEHAMTFPANVFAIFKRFPLDGVGICAKLTTRVACNIQMQHKNAESL